MAVIKIKDAPYPSKYGEFSGLSTDDKPTDAGMNSLFLELDTSDVYYWDGTGWLKVGGDSGSDDSGDVTPEEELQ